MVKKIISVNVDSAIHSKFMALCRDRGLVMSKQVENFMKKYMEENK